MCQVIKIRIYPNVAQQERLAQAFGCARWCWNNRLAKTQAVYKETDKGVVQFALNARLTGQKQAFEWLGQTHRQVVQSVSLHRSRAFVRFFEKRAKHPGFKRKHKHRSTDYLQGVKIVVGCKIDLPKIGHIKPVVHRELIGKMKTVNIRQEAKRLLASACVATACVGDVRPKRGHQSSVAAVACEPGSPVL